jgi:hypothetical protein
MTAQPSPDAKPPQSPAELRAMVEAMLAAVREAALYERATTARINAPAPSSQADDEGRRAWMAAWRAEQEASVDYFRATCQAAALLGGKLLTLGEVIVQVLAHVEQHGPRFGIAPKVGLAKLGAFFDPFTSVTFEPQDLDLRDTALARWMSALDDREAVTVGLDGLRRVLALRAWGLPLDDPATYGELRHRALRERVGPCPPPAPPSP